MNDKEKYTKKVWDERYKEGKETCAKKPGQGDPLDYTQLRFLYQHSIAKRLTGRLNGNPMDVWGKKFFQPPAHSVLAIGSGLAYAEEELVQKGFAEHVTIYEMSTEAVKAASERIKRDGFEERFCFKNEDILEADIEPNSYDAIFIAAAIHHFFEIEKMFQLMYKVLKPNGLLVYNEYIGPDHHLYEPEVMNIMNEMNGCLDEHYRYDCLRKSVREEMPEVTLEWMMNADPSEGVHASMILPLTYKYFNVEFRGDYGGTIMRPFFTAILNNFDFDDYKDKTIARLIVNIEDILLKNGIIPHYHTHVVARKRNKPLKPFSLEQFARVNYSDWEFQCSSGPIKEFFMKSILRKRAHDSLDSESCVESENEVIINRVPSFAPLNLPVFGKYEDYQRYKILNEKVFSWRLETERALIGKEDQLLPYEGYCCVCGKKVLFQATWEHSYTVDGVIYPNYREHLSCLECGFNSRMRGVIHVFHQLLKPDDSIYIMEQLTPMYSYVSKKYPKTIGSEFLENSVPFGQYKDGIRNEDVTNLTFSDEQFDAILSFDVFEHVFDFRKAFQECARVLKPSGRMILTVPFFDQRNTLVRAKLGEDGSVEHLLEPEYHGNPLSEEGCLCVYHYGWDILDELRVAGFSWAGAISYWSKEYGFMGSGEQLLFMAIK